MAEVSAIGGVKREFCLDFIVFVDNNQRYVVLQASKTNHPFDNLMFDYEDTVAGSVIPSQAAAQKTPAAASDFCDIEFSVCDC